MKKNIQCKRGACVSYCWTKFIWPQNRPQLMSCLCMPWLPTKMAYIISWSHPLSNLQMTHIPLPHYSVRAESCWLYNNIHHPSSSTTSAPCAVNYVNRSAINNSANSSNHTHVRAARNKCVCDVTVTIDDAFVWSFSAFALQSCGMSASDVTHLLSIIRGQLRFQRRRKNKN